MKKAMICLVICAVLLAGCGQKPESASGAVSSAASQSAASQSKKPQAASSASSSSASSKPTQSVGKDIVTDILPTGKFLYGVKDMYPEAYTPALTLTDDGMFTFLENLLEGMGTYTGTYTQEGDALKLKVQNVSFSNFLGSDVTEISLTIQDNNTLVLNTHLCSSEAGVSFVREEPKAE